MDMKIRLLESLRCPCCKSELRLSRIESHKVGLSPEASGRATAEGIDHCLLEEVVETGVLECSSGCSWYPIVNYVPVLLDFPLPLRSEEHTSELQSHSDLVCRLLLEKKKQAE